MTALSLEKFWNTRGPKLKNCVTRIINKGEITEGKYIRFVWDSSSYQTRSSNYTYTVFMNT